MSRLWRKPVGSSSIATMGYDPTSRILDIEFKESGEVYRYFDVPAAEYEAFLEAPSKGTYLNQHLKMLDTGMNGCVNGRVRSKHARDFGNRSRFFEGARIRSHLLKP